MDIRANAKKIQKFLDSSLKLWPFNRFKPEECDWWFAATSDNPAFSEAKIFVSSVPEQIQSPNKAILAGFYIEKGLSGVASEFYPSKLVMDRAWDWQHLSDGKYQDQIISIIKEITQDSTIYITLDISLLPIEKVNDSSNLDLIKNEFQATKLVYSIDDGLELQNKSAITNNLDKESSKIVAEFKDIVSLAHLLDRLQSLENIYQWRWIDFRIGAVMGESIDQREIDKLIKPWQKLLLS